MNEQLKSHRIKNNVITPGSFITADSPFLNKRAQSRLVHHTVKQLTTTLNAVLASAERDWCTRLRACVIPLTATPVDLKMNVNPFSVSVGALNPS